MYRAGTKLSMERRPYKGAALRVYGVSVPVFLVCLALPVLVGLYFLNTDFGSLEEVGSNIWWLSLPWYAYLSLIPVIFVPMIVHRRQLERLPCPQCRTTDTKCEYLGRSYKITCDHCDIRWETGIRRNSKHA